MTVLEGERHGPAEGGHWELSGLAAESGQSEEPKEICRGLPKVSTCRLHERRCPLMALVILREYNQSANA